MFKTRNNTPLSMNNLLNDQILPVLTRCRSCQKGTSKHVGADHEYKRDKSLPEWHGFHAFRRGLATNLHDLGVDDLTIQQILRHSDVSVTQRCYIKTLPAQTLSAMNKLQATIDEAGLICNESAKEVVASEMVN